MKLKINKKLERKLKILKKQAVIKVKKNYSKY